MRAIKRILTLHLAFLFIISSVNVYANSAAPLNMTFEVTIDGIVYTVPTPLDASSAPVTIKIIKDGTTVYQRTIVDKVDVTCDATDFRVVSDGIDHRVVSDGIDHRMIEISQNGLVVFTKQI